MTDGGAVHTVREQVESVVLERARHDTKDKIGDTRSFANMEQTLKREYWGRFLIELIQNARDAWQADGLKRRDGLLRIVLTEDPALVVCNEGDALTSDIILDSIAKFGESPKKPGEGIGHKGIGFKAVLELTRTPRIYSRRDVDGPFDLSVFFDPHKARELIMRESPTWDALVARLSSAAADDGQGDRIPILRFPMWDDQQPAWLDGISELDGRRFNTVIALPYDARFDSVTGLTRDEFLARVRSAFGDVTDEVVLLLGVFSRIVIEDRPNDRTIEITRSERILDSELDGVTLSEVEISRDATQSSCWWLFERSLPESNGLEGDLGVAIRLAGGESGRPTPVNPRDELRDGSSADCFHLFFPTRIRTHLPYLLNAYFEVDAGRKGFAEDKVAENERRLDGLRQLVLDATGHLARHVESIDVAPLPGLFAATEGSPEDELAREFREELLRELDTLPWVVTRGERAIASPRDLLVDELDNVQRILPEAFPPGYVERRTGRHYPLADDPGALGFLARRSAIARETPVPGLDGGTLLELLHPGQLDAIWDGDRDAGFQKVLEIMDIVKRRATVSQAIETLRSDTQAVFIPVVDGIGGRRLRAPGHDTVIVDDEDEPVPVGAILARVTVSGETPLVPPRSLGLDFLRDGLLDAEQMAGIGSTLGIRPYLTEVIIDGLARAGTNVDESEALPFTWRLLLRERGKYSIINVLRAAAKFDPGAWFWSKAEGNTTDARESRRRARALAMVRLPAREGRWRPATELVFGADWADWFDAHAADLGMAAATRSWAYRDLEVAAPDPSLLVASPETLVQYLGLSPDDITWADTETAPDLPPDPEIRHIILIHAFLLRLGVWEIPPIRGFVNYRHPRPVEGPPWSNDENWERLRAAHPVSGAPFAQYGHANVHVSEDYCFAWPLTSEKPLVRSLGRGADFYRAYRKMELFCSQCSGEHARWHQRRYSSDGDGRILSYLAWQLSEESWVPTATWGASPAGARPRESWMPDERPDDARMQQSWMRFLPIASPDVDPALASLAGVRRLSDADVPRIEDLLRVLRSRFESGEVDPERRAGSFASQTFVGLHWRLYEQLAYRDQATAHDALDRVWVLAVLGRSLEYRPRSEIRHDDGSNSGFRRYFAGRVPFVVLPKDMGPVADNLGIERFRVEVERVKGGKETDVTSDVRPFIHDRAAELLSLQVFHPLGTKALQLDGREFPIRAERLRALRVVRVDDLVLSLTIPSLGLAKEIGADHYDDLYLDDRGTPPILFIDLNGTRWSDRLRALAGPHLAQLLENTAYGATFQLLLQAETEAELEAFLEERSISSEDVELVRSQIDVVAGVVRSEERRWWRAVLRLLGASAPVETDGDAYRKALREQVERCTALSQVPGLGQRLLRAGGGEGVRHEGSPGGALAALEEHGIDLAELHQLLVGDGDAGIAVHVGAQRLAEWRRAHEREVVAVLVTRRMDPETAKGLPDLWAIAQNVSLRVRPTPSEYLAAVVADLHLVGLDVDPERLASPSATDYLAELAQLAPERMAEIWHGLFDEGERARHARDRGFAWKRVLRPILVCARTHAGDQSHVIRTEAATVDALLPAAPDDPAEIADVLDVVIDTNAELARYLSGRIRDESALADPSLAELRPDLETLLDGQHLDRVILVLQRGQRQLVDRVRQDIAQVHEEQLEAAPFVGAKAPAPLEPKPPAPRVQVRPRRPHDQRTRDRLGIQGERIALAIVIDAIQKRPVEEQNAIVDQLVALLLDVASGEIVDRLVAEARAAQTAVDDDDRLESMAKFLHVAQESDDFGFDVLGYLPPFKGSEAQPMLLEVKNASGRAFIASTAEWRRAQEQGDRYAFLVMIRTPTTSLELIPNPSELLDEGQIRREADSWAVSYELLSKGPPSLPSRVR